MPPRRGGEEGPAYHIPRDAKGGVRAAVTIHEVHPHLVPKTPLYKATYYAIHREQAFRRCFTDGHFEILIGHKVDMKFERSLKFI